jgi:phage-related baseplate assembly protein
MPLSGAGTLRAHRFHFDGVSGQLMDVSASQGGPIRNLTDFGGGNNRSL